MLHVRWESAQQTIHGAPVIEEFHSTESLHVSFQDSWLIIKNVDTDALLLSVPAWRIIDVRT